MAGRRIPDRTNTAATLAYMADTLGPHLDFTKGVAPESWQLPFRHRQVMGAKLISYESKPCVR
jgi:hypothetical protein